MVDRVGMKYIISLFLISVSFNGFSESNNSLQIVPLEELSQSEGPWSSDKPKCKNMYVIPGSSVQLSVCAGWGMTTTFERDGKVLLTETDFGDADFYQPHFVKTRNYDLLVAEIGADLPWGVRIYNLKNGNVQYLDTLDIYPGDDYTYDSTDVVDIIQFTDLGERVKISFTGPHYWLDEKGIGHDIAKDAYYYELTADSIVKVEGNKTEK
ncbi:conserved hypothetical protein [Vibrio nigripulchritudo MADA3029]|nr:conserved hypothetical protein [Vibrio nigripulchritudo MADA3020]CCN52879.1 conserved hypothetical protein [Vibrio nigripulchritudo MADA3021]CCN61686.1 conserved hypothetical protein [Vibrio nigripulchritudo MADA3029]